jgi:hypothetical protein
MNYFFLGVATGIAVTIFTIWLVLRLSRRDHFTGGMTVNTRRFRRDDPPRF